MSLRKKQTMTPKKISANRANGKLTHGPATPEGRERIRAANTRHGLYSKAEAVALACMGEDPAELEGLRHNLHDDSQASAALRKELAEHLVQVVWRWKRAGRSQEGFALRLAKEANLTRDDRVHAHMMRLKMTEESLRLLARSVGREHYVTAPADLEMMKSLHEEGVVKEMAEIALALFYQLQAPGTGADGVDPEEHSRRALFRIKEIFGLAGDAPPTPKVAFYPGQAQDCRQEAGTPPGPGVTPPPSWPLGSQQYAGAGGTAAAPPSSPPVGSPPAAGVMEKKQEVQYPNITAAEWEARERPRHLLENILNRQVEICEAQRMAMVKESLAGPSPYERAAEIALAHPDTAMMQRMEESSFRQIWRITHLLLKMERQARQAEI